ncbi:MULTISPECIES: thiamine phosphate synthase [unclassified Mucilaginibacter]|uniref:thiamine phosphate synthase n=1 Tax=unclassified Mucilaginibacter TaxID=2617802 RepID=UPI002AC933EE|nr:MULTISPECIES: thiamine phosphate synthase [unclassified Mucilaginibacter]MEB0261980.1 thiamine phosphate synthase [Mucilaginibacter sp. 10I4]MEB0277280.1 thiamine phosphate synthase [Mucilaginibacter sp. 10B2]MEB0300856.1 thiamine phosphate synthase [Mucilaginibacter sp. 5C4]WPX25406.1 thiamine phosphate synthase [Mucilaginibacter sp. 5C4]
MELIVISNPTPLIDEPILINNLFMAGLKCFHLRKPESDIRSVKDLLNGIAPRFYERIALHQYHEIAAEYGIKRLHYTEMMREASNSEKWRSQLDDGFRLSTSIHDVSLLHDLMNFDYVFYGPVFDSISKPGYQSTLDADFKLDKANIKPKVIALGGVEISNLTKLKMMGFDGAAVLGTLWNEPNKAVECFIQLKENLPD